VQFVRNLQRAVDLVLGRIIGALGARSQIARAFQPHCQLMLDIVRHLVAAPSHTQ